MEGYKIQIRDYLCVTKSIKELDHLVEPWERSFLIELPGGALFVPAAMYRAGKTEDELLELIRADGARFVQSEGHYYVHIDWVDKRFPYMWEFARGVRLQAKEAMRQYGQGN